MENLWSFGLLLEGQSASGANDNRERKKGTKLIKSSYAFKQSALSEKIFFVRL